MPVRARIRSADKSLYGSAQANRSPRLRSIPVFVRPPGSWERHELTDSVVVEGIPSVEADELAVIHKRIAHLESELALTRDASVLLYDDAVVRPKRRRATGATILSSIYLLDNRISTLSAATPP